QLHIMECTRLIICESDKSQKSAYTLELPANFKIALTTLSSRNPSCVSFYPTFHFSFTPTMASTISWTFFLWSAEDC
ncbi:hypothetical protein HN51_040687, partial [Arachis hypogaea]